MTSKRVHVDSGRNEICWVLTPTAYPTGMRHRQQRSAPLTMTRRTKDMSVRSRLQKTRSPSRVAAKQRKPNITSKRFIFCLSVWSHNAIYGHFCLLSVLTTLSSLARPVSHMGRFIPWVTQHSLFPFLRNHFCVWRSCPFLATYLYDLLGTWQVFLTFVFLRCACIVYTSKNKNKIKKSAYCSAFFDLYEVVAE